MRKIYSALLVVFSTTVLLSQQLTQTVRGSLSDFDSKSPLVGAMVVISGSSPILGSVTDVDGNFRIEKVPIGRVTIQLSLIGYEPKTIPDIVVNSAKEIVLELNMQESAVKMDEVVVTSNKEKGQAGNDMAVVSARSISTEETNRYAGGFNDPSKIVANFAGVSSSQDGGNNIIVRGNSPKFVQWRLEGAQITNPNHFGDQNSIGKGVSMLNNNLLATSDFYTGAFAPEYGDVLSGVYDIKLRTGNNEKIETVLGVGILGTDVTMEGPFKKGYAGSFIFNYRYSTVSLVNDLGLVKIGGVPKYQDAAFKVNLPTKKLGTFSLFGLGGASVLKFDDVTPDTWNTPGDRSMLADIKEDMQKKASQMNYGIKHTLLLNENSYIQSTISYANEGIKDKVFESKTVDILDVNGIKVRDSVIDRVLNFNSNLIKSTYRGALTYNNKINSRNKIQIGIRYSLFDYELKQSQFKNDPSDRSTIMDFKHNISTLNNFISWKYRINENLTFVSGLHNMNVMFNNKSTLEPRLAFKWKLNNTNSVHAGYGKHSNMESVPNYFAKIAQPDGSVTEPNKNLDLLKAHHFIAGYEKRFSENLMAKAEIYYQYLYNLPVENNATSYYCTVNETEDIKYVELVNKGKGKNYGIEFTLERFSKSNYYYLINTSLYNSKYIALDGKERNTAFNGNYIVNILAGKEFVKLGKKDNQTLGLNAKVFFGGGKRVIPLLRNADGSLAVDPANNRYYDYDKAYEHSLGNSYQVQISASYKWNKRKATHEFFVNLDNVTNNKAKLSEFYDKSKPNSIGYVTQLGFFPNLMYRVYF